jgi:hypothetical protein
MHAAASDASLHLCHLFHFCLYRFHLSAISASAASTSAASASTSTSDRNLHLVNLFRIWIYYPTVPLPQSVTDSLMETDQEGDGSGRRGNPKERMPEKGTEPTE